MGKRIIERPSVYITCWSEATYSVVRLPHQLRQADRRDEPRESGECTGHCGKACGALALRGDIDRWAWPDVYPSVLNPEHLVALTDLGFDTNRHALTNRSPTLTSQRRHDRL